MARRNNKKPGVVAWCLLLLILLATASFAWVAMRGLQKEPHGAVVGSDVLPGQAAHAAGAAHVEQPHP